MESDSSRQVSIRLIRNSKESWTYQTTLLPDHPDFSEVNWLYTERLIKFLLWAWGAPVVEIDGAPELLARLAKLYGASGSRSFDANVLGNQCFLTNLSITDTTGQEEQQTLPDAVSSGHDLNGCRIGFDLGGSDRKCAAIVDGEVVFSTEVKWHPYFEKDPAYHIEGIRDSLRLAADHLPRVDAIGGSAAGIYIDNEPRVASLFRGISKEDFDRHIRGIFKDMKKEWGDIPVEVANDGDVTALAGAMMLKSNGVLGISMGTSLAAGYIDSKGKVTSWLNELAFAPIDYRANGPADEWSKDRGCGVQYFSQQAVGRLIPNSGLDIDPDLALPEKLEAVQKYMLKGDPRAKAIFQTIGIFFGYGIAHYADFYDIEHVLFLGRVSSGEGGQIIKNAAEKVLEGEFPELAKTISISFPDEHMKRHGQAIAAATLTGKLNQA
jgi:predicted NBD/HSP70 family sugar kinase